MQSGHPPPAIVANQLTSISQTGTTMAGGVTVMPGHVVQAPQVSAGTPVVSGSNMMSMSMVTSTIANSTPYQFPITSHTNTSSIQPTPGYPANAAQAIIYVRKTLLL